MSLNKANTAIILAAQKGYTTDNNGNIISPNGIVLKLKHEDTYPAFSLNVGNKKIVSVRVHRFVAYLKFGDKIFEENIQVRHLNGMSNDNSWSNIDIGTASDNMLDKRPEVRKEMARKAASHLRSLSENDVIELRKLRKEGWKYKDLMNKFGLAKSTVSYIINDKTYSV